MTEKRFEEAKIKLGSEEALNRQLKLMGATREEVLAKWTESATAESVLKRELKVNITDADAEEFYKENPAKFEEPELIRASHILLMTVDPKTNAEMSETQKAAKQQGNGSHPQARPRRGGFCEAGQGVFRRPGLEG